MFNFDRELEVVNFGDDRYTIRSHNTYGEFTDVELYRNGRHYDTIRVSRRTGVRLDQDKMDNNMVRLRAKSEMRPTDHFFVRAGQRDWSKTQWHKLPAERFDNAEDCLARVKEHNLLASNDDSPFRFIVKKETELSPIKDYNSWAAERFENGEWEPAPWANEPWAQHDFHHAHLAKVDDSLIAYWLTEAHAQSDMITVMAPGRYLNQFYGDVLTPNEIRDWAVQVDAECELKFATTGDEMVAAYVANDTGCMRYADDSKCHDNIIWRSGKSPVRAYAAGDLAVAYLERKGKVIGRALVWPEKKAVGRIYGDVERMAAVFEADGWAFDGRGRHAADTRGEGLLNGARLLKIHPEAYPHNFAMPYLDFGYQITDSGEFFTLNRSGEFLANRTDGLLHDTSYPGDEDGDNDCENGDCECCFTCDRCSDTASNEERVTVNGEYWYCEPCAAAHATDCFHCESSFTTSNMVADESDDLWCSRCAGEHLTVCDYCSDRVPNDDINVVHDGRNEGDHHADACDNCFANHARIVTDINDVRVDISTVDICDEDHFYSSNLDTCPHPEHALETAA